MSSTKVEKEYPYGYNLIPLYLKEGGRNERHCHKISVSQEWEYNWSVECNYCSQDAVTRGQTQKIDYEEVDGTHPGTGAAPRGGGGGGGKCPPMIPLPHYDSFVRKKLKSKKKMCRSPPR